MTDSKIHDWCPNCTLSEDGKHDKNCEWFLYGKSELESNKSDSERDEAREIVQRALELASPFTHPEQWAGYRKICDMAVTRWEKGKVDDA